MWLLSTDRAELHYFSSPDAVTGGYAVLSHTWDAHEQAFQETQVFRDRCKETGENPRDLSSEKVRQCCILAERHGYQWIWYDACCIDKASSTDLSEAINSIFLWYSCAEVCFAYLADVESDCDLYAPDSTFRTSRWHSRGWTLQELITPSFVIFLSHDWNIIGNKRVLAQLLEEITGVRRQVLTDEIHYSMVSIRERMSWASKRYTTRMEDEAYSLMGLFDVNMPLMYGEGRQAFQRLQREILLKQRSPDMSLFTWGSFMDLNNTSPIIPGLRELDHELDFQDGQALLFAPSLDVFRSMVAPLERSSDATNLQSNINADRSHLSGQARFSSQLSRFARKELLRVSITNYGVECRLPIIESHGFTIAVLPCDTGDEHIGLFLSPSHDPIQDPSRRLYHIGCSVQRANDRDSPSLGFARLISLGNDFYHFNLRQNNRNMKVMAEWRNIIIANRPRQLGVDTNVAANHRWISLHSGSSPPPFRLPHWLVGSLTQIGLELQPIRMQSPPIAGQPFLAKVAFLDFVTRESLVVVLGTCDMRSRRTPTHWARVLMFSMDDRIRDHTKPEHDCRKDHVTAWPGWTKDFGDAKRTVRLSFSPCSLAPEHTLVVHVELVRAPGPDSSSYSLPSSGKSLGAFPSQSPNAYTY